MPGSVLKSGARLSGTHGGYRCPMSDTPSAPACVGIGTYGSARCAARKCRLCCDRHSRRASETTWSYIPDQRCRGQSVMLRWQLIQRMVGFAGTEAESESEAPIDTSGIHMKQQGATRGDSLWYATRRWGYLVFLPSAEAPVVALASSFFFRKSGSVLRMASIRALSFSSSSA